MRAAAFPRYRIAYTGSHCGISDTGRIAGGRVGINAVRINEIPIVVGRVAPDKKDMQVGIGMARHCLGAAAAARPGAARPGEVVAGGHGAAEQIGVDHMGIGAPKIGVGVAVRRVLGGAGVIEIALVIVFVVPVSVGMVLFHAASMSWLGPLRRCM